MSNLYTAWTNHKRVSDERAKAFLEYVNHNQAFLITIGDFVFDSQSMSSKIMLSQCLSCEKYQKGNCCKGNSYSMPQELIDRVKLYVPDILKTIPNGEARLESFYKHGAFTQGNSTTCKGHEDGYCLFSFKDSDGCEKCAIHAWCLKNNKNPAEYKPYICSLYPLEGIVMPNGKTFVFCSTKETNKFSMYFYTLTRRVCVNEEAMLRVYSDRGLNSYLRSINSDAVKKDNLLQYFRPAYIEQEGILRYLCGDDVYDELVQKIH